MIAAPHRKAWLDWLSIEKRYGDNTLLAYESDLDDFCTFVGNYLNPSWKPLGI